MSIPTESTRIFWKQIPEKRPLLPFIPDFFNAILEIEENMKKLLRNI